MWQEFDDLVYMMAGNWPLNLLTRHQITQLTFLWLFAFAGVLHLQTQTARIVGEKHQQWLKEHQKDLRDVLRGLNEKCRFFVFFINGFVTNSPA
jgi:hypothetical protein